MSDVDDTTLTDLGRRYFGWSRLRPEQRRAIHALLGGRDVLAVLASGAGKSAIFELPTIIHNGLTVVISPLVALQRNQVQALSGAIPARQLSGLKAREQAEALAASRRGEVRLLMLTPELLADPDRRAAVAELHPTLVAVDEAHCVSTWGYDFRPEYLHLGQALRDFGRPPVVALTATASSPVRADIIRFLGLDDPLVLISGLDRPNIHLNAVLCADEPTRTRRLREFVVGAHGSPGIVYCPTRRSTQEHAELLRAAGVDAHAYHAGLGAKQRSQLQDAFHNDSIAVMVATTAFGMGIDKPDVRWICHAALTDSPDSYYQEIGRAGRDGRPATALLLHREQDTGLRRYFAAVSVDPAQVAAVAEAVARAPTTRHRLATDLGVTRHRLGQLLGLLEQVGAVTTARRWLSAVAGGPRPATAAALAVEQIEAQHAIRLSRIQMMQHYAQTSHCRGRYLVAYFGDELPGPCRHCDNCDRTAGAQDAVSGPFPIHSTVQHRQWGRGTVLDYEQDRMTVLFDRVGYRTLALADVAHVLISDR